TYGNGKSATVETTARAVSALVAAHAPLADVDQAVTYLLGAKDSFGNWYSTQATILSLRALLEWQERGARPGRGAVHIDVDGQEVASVAIAPEADTLQVVDLPQATRPGVRTVSLRYDGSGAVGYQLVSRWYVPRATAPASSSDLAVRVTYDRSVLAPSE